MLSSEFLDDLAIVELGYVSIHFWIAEFWVYIIEYKFIPLGTCKLGVAQSWI